MKKYIAFLIAVVMTLSMSVPVFATTPVPDPVAGQIGGRGTVVDADMDEVIRMTLPTQNSFEFFLDPIGLLGQGAGTIVFPSSFNPAFISRSSTDIRLGVEYSVGGAANLVANNAAVTGVERGVAVQVVSSAVNVSDPAADFQGITVVNHVYGAANNWNRSLFEYVLPAGHFVIAGTGDNARLVPDDEPNWQGTQIQLRGRLNPNSNDWTGTQHMTMNIRFSFKDDLAGLPVTSRDGAYHLKAITPGATVFDTIEETVFGREVAVGFLVDGRTVDSVRVSSAFPYWVNIPVYPNHLAPNGLLANTLVSRVRFVAEDETLSQDWRPYFSWFAWGGPAGARDSLELLIAGGVAGYVELEMRDAENLRVYVYIP